MERNPDFLIAVGDGFSLFDLATLREPLGAADRNHLGLIRHKVVALSPDTTSDSGIVIDLQVWDGRTLPSQWLILLCGRTGETDPRVRSLLDSTTRSGVALCGIGPAVFALGAAGMLDGRACSVHPALMQEFQQRFPQARPIDSAYHIDAIGQTIGGTTNIDFILHLLSERFTGIDMASLVACLCHRPLTTRDAPHVEARAKADPVIDAAFRLMRLNLHQSLKIGQIARSLNRSQRVLERQFRDRLGISPGRAYAWLRVQAAQHMLLHSDMSLDEIVTATGCGSRTKLNSLYRRHYGVPLPSPGSRTPFLQPRLLQSLAA